MAAGLSVAAIALPVGIAYAELAGVPAAIGIYAAIFPLVPYAAVGSSRQLILGPDAATCIMVGGQPRTAGARRPGTLPGAPAGADVDHRRALRLAGLARLGFFANFLSQPILTGYLNGVAIVIIVGQLPKLLGYPSEADEVLPRLLELASDSTNRIGRRRRSGLSPPRRAWWHCAGLLPDCRRPCWWSRQGSPPWRPSTSGAGASP